MNKAVTPNTINIRWVAASGVWFYITSIIILYICLSPHTPASQEPLVIHGLTIISYSIIPASVGALLWWLGYIRGVAFIRSGGSIGLATSITLLPFYITLMLLGSLVILVGFTFSGYLLSKIQSLCVS